MNIVLDKDFIVLYMSSQSFSQEGTMCTEFHYREKDCSSCEMKPYSLLSPGGFMSGPRAIRLERLQWLTTSAVNRLAFMRTKMWSSGVGLIAQAAPNRSIHRVDTVRSGALEELAFRPKTLRLRLAFGHFVFEISARLKAVNGHSPPIFFLVS